MLSNNEIVDYVYRNYKIGGLIRRLIKNSVIDESFMDLEQYIYLLLLEMENKRLNDLYNKKKLRQFICRIIIYQRNYNSKFPSKTNGIYNKYFKITGVDPVPDSYSEDKHDFRIDFIYNELEKVPFGTTGLTNNEMRKMLSYEILKYYIEKGISMTAVAKKFGLCRTTTRTLIIEAKNNIRIEYERNYDNYINTLPISIVGIDNSRGYNKDARL